MPKNVMKLLKRKANYARHDFDLSHRHLLTLNFGELVPATFIEVVPDDYIEFKAADLIRAAPMVTSPFLRAKQHIDLWYVPYDYLWSNFTSFMTQKSQPTSSALKGQSFIPHANKFNISSLILGQSEDTDVVGRAWSKGARKLFDLCGYGRVDASGTYDLHPEINLWRIAAYNKIWYDEYRQQYFDNGVRFLDVLGNDSPAAMAWNFDDLACTSAADSSIGSGAEPTARLKEMFQMRYRCWKKDLYTGIMPSQQFGNVSSVSFEPSVFTLRNNGTGSAQSGDLISVFQTFDNGEVNTALNRNGTVVSASSILQDVSERSFDILSLRKAQAVQIWRERALTAGNRVSDNFKAHYGDEARYDDHRATFLGSVDAPLNIADIDATAQTGASENGSLADVAGKGTSTLQDKVFKFKGHEFGVIVAMMSILPEAEYQSQGIDRMNQLLEWEDYFNPVFQDLGLEAVSSQNFYSTLNSVSKTIGYAPRFFGYKQKLDKCYHGFYQDGSEGSNDFSAWASPKYDVQQALNQDSSAIALSTLYVNPALFDNNFVSGVENSSQFIVDVYFDVSAVRQMSPSGLPNY